MKSFRSQQFNQLTKSILLYICIICIGVVLYAVFQFYSSSSQYEFILQDQKKSTQLFDSISFGLSAKDTMININSASKEDFVAVGFSEKQAQTICNYRNKGGVFYSERDLLKIYGISEKKFEACKKYLFVSKEEKRGKKKYTKNISANTYQDTVISLEINTATYEDFIKINGVGDFRANKIIEYREKLGGFYAVSQLKEVYSIDSACLYKILPFCYVDTSFIVPINVNTASFSELQSHPYCGYYRAKDIINYVRIQKKIERIDELLHENIITNSEYFKLES